MIKSLIISSISGLATLLGIIPIFIKCDPKKIINFSLSFAAGVMTSISLFELIPESSLLLSSIFYNFPKIIIILIFVNIGIILGILIDKLVFTMNKLYKLGIISLIAIILHNIPEGIITFLTVSNNYHLGILITIAIMLHNIPEGISIAVPIFYAKKNRKKALFYVFIAALAEPLGALIAYLFLTNISYNIFIGLLLSITAGIMLEIACFEFIPIILNKNNKTNIIIYILGFIITILLNTVMK